MLESSESGSDISSILERLVITLEKQRQLRQKVATAFAYPIVVIILCAIVVTILVAFIVPVFATAYGKLGVQLPGLTQGMVYASTILREFWPYILFAAGVGTAGVLVLRKTETFRHVVGVMWLRAPILGSLTRMIAVSRFLRNFSSMLNSGVPIQKSLEIAEQIAVNPLITSVTNDIQEAIRAGESILGPMRSSGVFPPMVLGMAAAGETSGTMPEMLEKCADHLDEDIDTTIKRLLIKLEPAITVGLAVIVGFILMAVYLPIFDIMKVTGS
jgi:type IV pilus assembly protein PilC